MDEEIVIVGDDGTEHVFPAGMDPKRAAAIVRGQAQPQTTPAQDVEALFGRDGGQPIADPATRRLSEKFGPDTARQITDESKWMKDDSFAMGAPGVVAGVKAIATKGPGVIARGLGISKARAGANIAEAVAAAKDVPLDVATSIGGPLKEIMGYKGIETVPMSVRSLSKAVESGQPLTVELARKYYPAISRMSANEFASLTPNMQRLVGGLRAAMNEGITASAETVGKGAQYAAGMKEYARAGKVGKMVESVTPAAESALRKALEALGIGTGGMAAYRLFKD